MRRFFAFIIMVVSIVAAIIFNTQAVMDGRLLSLEYGGGRELVYSLTQREGGQQVNAEKIGDNILNRLDKAGIRNADIELVGNDQIRITFAAQTTNDYNNARTLIEANGSLTVVHMMTGVLVAQDSLKTMLLLSIIQAWMAIQV